MWKNGQHVTITGYNKHKAVVKKCENENNRILATAQRARFKEAKEKLAEQVNNSKTFIKDEKNKFSFC